MLIRICCKWCEKRIFIVSTYKYEDVSITQVGQEDEGDDDGEAHCDPHSEVVQQTEEEARPLVPIVGQSDYRDQQSLGLSAQSHLSSQAAHEIIP